MSANVFNTLVSTESVDAFSVESRINLLERDPRLVPQGLHT